MTTKRIISFFLCACLLITSVPAFTVFAENQSTGNEKTEEFIRGDVSGDGKIQANDARMALRHSAKIEILSGGALLAADYDGDSTVLANDARLILRVAAGLESHSHELVFHEAKEATCSESGSIAYYSCTSCGKYFADEKAEKQISSEDIIVTAEHKPGEWVTEKTAAVDSNGLRTRKCTVCGEIIESEVQPYIDPNEQKLVAYFKVEDGKVVNKAATAAAITGASVTGDYFTGGSVTLPQGLDTWTLQMLVDYNEQSDKGIINNIVYSSNSGKYEECDNVFRLEEVNSVNQTGIVRTAWVADSWNTGYVMSVPVQLYAHTGSNREYLPLGDSFWSLSADAANGTVNFRIDGQSASANMPQYTKDGANAFVNKILPKSFGFTSDHMIKEIKIYSTALTNEDKENAYKAAEIVLPDKNINRIVDGITDMGSSLAFVKDKDGKLSIFETEKTAGTHTVSDYYRPTTYTVKDFVQPDVGIDNSKYESVHITNEPATLQTGKQYPLTAYPYPYDPFGAQGGKAEQFDITWSSSDTSVMAVIDGLLIAKKAGTVQITAALTGTDIKDVVTVTVKDPEKTEDKVWNVPSDYKSKNGYVFSETDYQSTTRAIYDAIDEAAANGYNHVVFPKQNFYAVPLLDETTGDGYRYCVPSHMTDSDVSKLQKVAVDLRYFTLGVKGDNLTDVCENSHIIVDKYYGERYNTTAAETSYLEENCFAYIGRKAVNCSVEIHEAYSPAGYFIGVDGTTSSSVKSSIMSGSDFTSGRLSDDGTIKADSKWISTKDFIPVPNNGNSGYFISNSGQDFYAQKYYSGCSARVYDIQWFNADKQLILTERFLGRGEYYDIPDNAAYFKLSLLQSSADYASGEPWIAMHDDGSAKMCEIKNTKVYNSACGIFSVVGETDGLWVHD